MKKSSKRRKKDAKSKTTKPGTVTEGEKQKLHLQAEKAESAAADVLESASKKLEDIAARLAHA